MTAKGADMNAHARFAAVDAAEERATTARPLLIGLTGPSGSGKTYSALRLATGIQTVVGGDIYVVDTEQRRSLDYAGDFSFKFVDFKGPFGSLDYLEALRFCKASGAGVVVIDSCSHEHEGPGGLLEQHEAELDRLAGTDTARREKMKFSAWRKPKEGRKKLITAITTELNMPTIFCFRARQKTKPIPGKQPVDMGFTCEGAIDWLFELSLNALFLPGSDGVPIWTPEKPGEKLSIKLPKQFRSLAERQIQFSEQVGRKLALWAAPGGNRAPVEQGPRFEAHDTRPDTITPDSPNAEEGPTDEQRGDGFDGAEDPQREKALAWVTDYKAKVAKSGKLDEIAAIHARANDASAKLKREYPDLYEEHLSGFRPADAPERAEANDPFALEAAE